MCRVALSRPGLPIQRFKLHASYEVLITLGDRLEPGVNAAATNPQSLACLVIGK